MAESGRERAPDTHMTDIYRRRGRSVHLSSRTGADVDHDDFFYGRGESLFPGWDPPGENCARAGTEFFFGGGCGRTTPPHFGTFRSRVAIDAREYGHF